MAPAATLEVGQPHGGICYVRLEPLPFLIGRLGDNHLVLRDSRASRVHARISFENGAYVVEDTNSRSGVYVNGERIRRRPLRNGDKVEFGLTDSYRLTFQLDAAQPAQPVPLLGNSMAKLRATLEVARALQSSLSTDEVLASVVEAALAVTGCERGFLLLLKGGELEIRLARSRHGPLPKDDLRIPTRLLLRALRQRKEFLSMNFDPAQGQGPEQTIAALDLRSVVCVPLVRVRSGSVQETTSLSAEDDTAGLLYMDSRVGNADLSSGGRELLTSLAVEASTVLENARLLEEQWEKQRMDQELRIARRIQQSLLPRQLLSQGWFRAAGSSLPSLEVGGDFLDVREIDARSWASVVADVSGKGVGAALLASLLQGTFLAAPYSRLPLEDAIMRLNRFLNERTGGEEYATIFYATLHSDGALRWVNAGHLPPMLLSGRSIRDLPATGTPVGLLDQAGYTLECSQLVPGDKLIVYSDGLTEARNPAGEMFGRRRLKDILHSNGAVDCADLHCAILAEVDRFTHAAPQRDDITLLVLEYAG